MLDHEMMLSLHYTKQEKGLGQKVVVISSCDDHHLAENNTWLQKTQGFPTSL